MPQPTAGTIVAQFIAGVGETVTSLKVSAWADQSGNGYDVTQSSAGERPCTETQGSSRVAHDIAVGRQALDRFGEGIFPLHASQPHNFQNLSMFVVARINNSALHQVNSDLTLGAAFGFTNLRDMLWVSSGKLQYYDESGNDPTAQVATAQLTCAPTVYAARLHSSGSQFAFGDRIVPGTLTATAHTSTGGWIGRGYFGSHTMPSCVAYEFVFVSDLDAAGFAEWCQWLQGKWATSGVYTPKTSTMVMVGDSTLAGEPVYASSSTIAEKLSDLFPQTHVLSAAVNSQLVSGAGGNQVVNQILRSQYLLNGTLATGEISHPFPVRLCVIMAGTNDINTAVSAATIKAAFTSRVTEARGYGATHVGICTIMDSTFHDATEDLVRAQVNTDIKNLASGIGHDFVINLHESANGGDDRLNNATTNVGGLFEDGLHPSVAGIAVITTIISNAVEPYLLSGTITVVTPSGTVFLTGSTYSVVWNSVGTSGNVNIRLSVDNGATFPITLESEIADIESYSWTPTAEHCGTQVIIRVEDAADDTIYDDTTAMIVATTDPGGASNTALWFRLQELAINDGLELSRP